MFKRQTEYICCTSRQLGNLVARTLACYVEGFGFEVRTLGGEPTNFQNSPSSAVTQQPVDHMRHKAKGCLVLSVLC